MSRTVRVTGVLLLAIALMAIVGPWLSPHDYVTTDFNSTLSPPSLVDQHFFGTDDVAIVRRPETHPEAFLRGAAQYAGRLEDPLLIIHGMQDQVVPFKTVVDLAEELMRKGKDFDFAFAPAGTHGWTRPPHYARFLLGKLIAHFERHLGPVRP